MTLLEVFTVTLLIAGAFGGVGFGYTHLGITGAVLGAFAGLGVGLLLSCGIGFLLNRLFPTRPPSVERKP